MTTWLDHLVGKRPLSPSWAFLELFLPAPVPQKVLSPCIGANMSGELCLSVYRLEHTQASGTPHCPSLTDTGHRMKGMYL